MGSSLQEIRGALRGCSVNRVCVDLARGHNHKIAVDPEPHALQSLIAAC